MNTPKDIEVLKEKLAAIEHERWSDWQAWCHKVLRENCQSPELEKVLERWDRQIATPYAELSEAEKQSDRDQVDRYWHLITTLVDEVRAERDREIVEFLSTPLNTHDGVREKTVDDFVEYLQQKGNFVCPLDCGIEVEHTHPYGDIKKVYIK